MGEALLSRVASRFRRAELRAALVPQALLFLICTLVPVAPLFAADEPSAAPQSNEAGGEIVRAIEVHSDGPVDLEEVARLLDLEVGEPYSETAARRALKSLRYADLASEASIWLAPAATGDGVIVKLALWPPVRVTAVTLEGELGLKEERLRPARRLRADR